MDNSFDTDIITWFDSLVAPKILEASDNTVKCRIGFNRRIKANGVSRVVGEDIEVDSSTIAGALKDAKLQYEFLTAE